MFCPPKNRKMKFYPKLKSKNTEIRSASPLEIIIILKKFSLKKSKNWSKSIKITEPQILKIALNARMSYINIIWNYSNSILENT